MTDPLLHDRTKSSLQLYLKRPAHALLLIGEQGIGKIHLAKWLADQLEEVFHQISPEEDKDSISIDQIRQLYGQTRTGQRQVIILEDAHSMSKDAQNAFLKLLEEPPGGIRFILTSHAESRILPTIRSRCQSIKVLRPKKDLVLQAASDIDSTIAESLYHTTSGLPGKFFNTLSDEATLKTHQQVVSDAKRFYSQDSYQRHLLLIENKFDKDWLAKLLVIISIICQSLIAANKDNRAALKKIIHQAELIEEVSISLKRNGNLKIHLSKLANLL